MPNGICPKCMVNPIVPKRSYCLECGREWQNNYNKTRPKQTRTREQKDAQNKRDRERIARKTPEEKDAHYARKQANRIKWLERNPHIRTAMNRKAKAKRETWSPERLELEKSNGKKHYARRMLRSEQGLCAYSVNCNNPPAGKQRFCVNHWIHGIRQADLRQKPEYTEAQLLELWIKQADKCAITGVIIIPGDTATLDHIVPVSRGGKSTIDNIRFIHSSVNRMKWNFTDEEFKAFAREICAPLLEWSKNPC